MASPVTGIAAVPIVTILIIVTTRIFTIAPILSSLAASFARSGGRETSCERDIRRQAMKILKRLWADEVGVIMSAETVMLGTMGVLAMTAGVGTMATAVNSELGEMGKAFRGFDQSFSAPGFQTSFGGSSGGGARSSSGSAAGMSGTHGSGYTQQSSAVSQAQLDIQMTQRQAVENELAGRVIQRLDAAQLQQFQQFSDLQRDNVCSGSEL